MRLLIHTGGTIGMREGPRGALAALAPLMTRAPSLRLRDRAVARLGAQLAPPYAPVDPADVPAWQAFFRERYAAITSLGRLTTVWRASARLADLAALPLLASRLRAVPMPSYYQIDFICQAHDLAPPADWAAFQDALQPWATLPGDVAAVLADPSQCANRHAAPPPLMESDDAAPLDRARWLRRAGARGRIACAGPARLARLAASEASRARRARARPMQSAKACAPR